MKVERKSGIAFSALALVLAVTTHASEESLEGTWTSAGSAGEVVELEFDGWDMLTVRVDGENQVVADYALEGASLFVTDIEGPSACDENVATATYAIDVSEDQLALTASGDGCAVRAERLDGRVFSRVD